MDRRARIRIDFDEWCRLAKDNPTAFEQRRRQLLEFAIRTAPIARQQRLRGLQWRIDHERRRAATPLAACLRISRMMWNAVQGENGLLAAMDALDCRWSGYVRSSSHGRPVARVLPFRRTD
ncbi:MAG: DUF3135 domain-containing protein [Aquisalimonadaceae bacterium]